MKMPHGELKSDLPPATQTTAVPGPRHLNNNRITKDKTTTRTTTRQELQLQQLVLLLAVYSHESTPDLDLE